MTHEVMEPALHEPQAPDAPEPRVGRGSYLFGASLLALLVGALATGWVTHAHRDAAAEVRAKTRLDRVPSVRVETVRDAPQTFSLELPGTVSPLSTASMNARATGYISKRSVDIGTRVHAGDVLAVIESRELDSQVRQARETTRQAKANLDLAGATAARSSSLVEKGYATHQRYDQDRLGQTAREADLHGAEAALATVEQRRAYLTVVSPFDGVVTQRNVDVGDLADADSASSRPLFVVARTDRVRVQVQVPQDAASNLAVGDAVSVVEAGDPGHPRAGKITRSAAALASSSRTLLVEAEIPNEDGALTPGSFVRVTFQVHRSRKTAVISADSLVYDADGLSVDVVKNAEIEKRKVKVGRDFGTEIEIPDGLTTGERIVLNPPSSLTDGAKVNILGDRPGP